MVALAVCFVARFVVPGNLCCIFRVWPKCVVLYLPGAGFGFVLWDAGGGCS